jgi:hypothetical protein
VLSSAQQYYLLTPRKEFVIAPLSSSFFFKYFYFSSKVTIFCPRTAVFYDTPMSVVSEGFEEIRNVFDSALRQRLEEWKTRIVDGR